MHTDGTGASAERNLRGRPVSVPHGRGRPPTMSVDDEPPGGPPAGTPGGPPAGPLAGTVITACEDGPLLVRGDFALRGQDGEPIATRRGTVALCRCGKSAIRPFCDGTHKLIGFRAPSGREGP